MSTNEADRIEELERILSGRPGVNGARTGSRETDTATTEGAAVDESGLPDPDADYKAFSNSANKPVYTLHCLMGAKGIVSFQYVNLDSHTEFQTGEHGQVITLRFSGTKIWEVAITGTDLRKLYDGIHRHVTPWVRRSDRGFAAGPKDEPVVMGIDIKDVTPKEPG